MRKALYVVLQKDLEPLGFAGAQIAHAAQEYGLYGTEDTGDTVVLLEASREKLAELEARAKERNLSHCAFREPDRAGELTALSFGPSARKLLSSLPKAFKNARVERSSVTAPAPVHASSSI